MEDRFIMMWDRTPAQDERRVRDFLSWEYGLSETAASLAHKLRVDRRVCRRVLDTAVTEGIVERRDFDDMAPIYVRFPER
jgi:DNA-binding transcriptional regulator LsrR (DeoR family)